jgi:hypothetical protein
MPGATDESILSIVGRCPLVCVEQAAEELVDDPVAGLPEFFAFGGETVPDRASWPGDSFDEATFGHACGERPEGLMGLVSAGRGRAGSPRGSG